MKNIESVSVAWTVGSAVTIQTFTLGSSAAASADDYASVKIAC